MNLANRKILILGANPETAGLVKKANELGVMTFVTDYDPNAFAKKYAAVSCDINAVDIVALKELIKRENIDGVICGVAESLMTTYAKICEDLGLPCYGNSDLFSLFVDKSIFKEPLSSCFVLNVVLPAI